MPVVGRSPVTTATFKDHLQGNMRKNSCRNQRTIQIRRIFCDKHQPVQQKTEQDKNYNRSEYTQLFTDDYKNHIILSLGNSPQFLRAVTQSLAKETSAADRIKPLQDLKTSGICSCLRIQPGNNSLDPEIITVLPL